MTSIGGSSLFEELFLIFFDHGLEDMVEPIVVKLRLLVFNDKRLRER
jgi:hypothetical protein